jgi:hypothetical protein
LVYKMNSAFVDKNELSIIFPVCVKCYIRDFSRYIPSLLYGCLSRLLSLGHVVPASPIQPIQNAFFLMIVIKKSRDTWGRKTLGRIPVWEQSLVFYLHGPVSSLFSIWHILLVQFQLHLSNHFWTIHLQHRQYSGQRKSRKGGIAQCVKY